MRGIAITLICMLFLTISGCGSNSNTEKENQRQNKNGQQSETVAKVQTVDKGQALKILTDKLEVSTDNSDYDVHLLREAKIGDALVYVFERVGLNGGAASVYFVDNQGTVYNDAVDLLVDYFKTCPSEQYYDGQYLNTDMYLLAMKSINDPEVITWETYIVNGKGYPDLDSAIKGLVADYIKNDKILSLLGKDVQYIEKATGQKAQNVTIADVDGVEDFAGTELIYNGVTITFFGGNKATDIFYPAGTKLLGVTIGDTFEQIMSVLGTPLTLEPAPYFSDIYRMKYVFDGNLSVEFYAESSEGKTASALVKDL
ncbi:hypothetical protein [Syntrophomonas erecta]